MVKENSKESEPNFIGVGLIACEDDHVKTGPHTLKFGVAGSGVVDEEGGGDTGKKIYPVEDRKLLKKAFSHIKAGLVKLTGSLGIPLLTCSHPGCGAGNAQGFTNESLIQETRKTADDNVKYAGHISVSDEPELLEGVKAAACITRKEDDHTHTAEKVRLTIGGGITGIEQEEQGVAFDISADWVGFDDDSQYPEERLTEEEKIGVLVAQMKLAWMITPNIRSNEHNPFIIFNGERVKDSTVLEENQRIAQSAIDKSLVAIANGDWVAPTDH